MQLIFMSLYITIGHNFYITYVESLTLTHRVPSKGWLIEPFLFTMFTKIPPYKNMQVSNIVHQIQYHFAKGEFSIDIFTDRYPIMQGCYEDSPHITKVTGYQ